MWVPSVRIRVCHTNSVWIRTNFEGGGGTYGRKPRGGDLSYKGGWKSGCNHNFYITI